MRKGHIRMHLCGICAATIAVLASNSVSAQTTLRVDDAQVKRWRAFAEALYDSHLRQLKEHEVRTEETIGGYANNPAFYREVRYFDAQSGRLLSEIQWETAHPDAIHNISVNYYDSDGRLSHDYYAGYLPRFRNAPIQTLLNLHQYNDGLHAFRQFDASGVRIYEQCRGEYLGEQVMVSLEEDDLPINSKHLPKGVNKDLYTSCFGELPTSVNSYLEALIPTEHQQQVPDS